MDGEDEADGAVDSICLQETNDDGWKMSEFNSDAMDKEKRDGIPHNGQRKKPAWMRAEGREKNLIVEEIKGKQEFTFLARGVLLRHQKQQAFRRWIECAPYRHLCDST